MKRTFKYALVAAFAFGVIAPAFAQTDNFPDVPENHWAYEALARLKKDGLLVGYPDGLFRGPRPASRYELAVAVHACYTNLRNVTDGLQSQIDALKNNTELQALKDQVAALQNEVNAMKGYGEDIAALKKLTDTFQNELHALGVDVDQLKKDLGDLARRVTALEAKKPAVDIGGDVSFFLIGGNGTSGDTGLSMDGRTYGALPTKYSGVPVNGSNNAGITQDLSILNQIAIKLAGTNTTGPQWKGTIIYGNTLSNLGDESTAVNAQSYAYNLNGPTKVGTAYTDTGSESIYIQDFSVKFKTSIAGLGFDADAGRIGYKISPYIFQRINPSSYFSDERWSNGMYYFDGANVGFSVLGAKVEVIGGRTSNQLTSEGINMNPLQSGGYGGPLSPEILGIDEALGITASVPITSAGNLKLAYLWLDSFANPAAQNTGPSFSTFGTKAANALNVYGGTLNFAIGQIKLQGDYSESDLKYNETTVNDTDATAWQAKASYGTHTWDIYGLYREIGANFMAPGDWGRIGILHNPTNIEGETFGLDLNLSHSLVLKGDYEHDQGKDNGSGNAYGLTSGFLTGTDLDKYEVSLGYKLNSNLDLSVGYEDDRFTGTPTALGVSGNPEYQWTTFGLSYGLSDAAKLTLQYQLSDVSNDFVIPGAAINNGLSPVYTNYKGGLLTSQLTIKF
jgi:polyhydroxyalkanoate synthesis regulator phasin